MKHTRLIGYFQSWPEVRISACPPLMLRLIERIAGPATVQDGLVHLYPGEWASALVEWRMNVLRTGATFFLASLLLNSDLARRDSAPVWSNSRLANAPTCRFQIQVRDGTRISALTADLSGGEYSVTPVPSAQEHLGAASLQDIAEKYSSLSARDVLGGMNGGFFDPHTGLPIGFLLRNGEMDFFNMPQGFRRSMIGFTDEAPGHSAHVVITPPGARLRGWLHVKSPGLWAHSTEIPIHHVNIPGGRDAITLWTPALLASAGRIVEGIFLGVERSTVRGRTVDVITSTTPLDPGRVHPYRYIIALHGESRAYAKDLRLGSRIVVSWTFPESWRKEHVVHGLLAGPCLLKNGTLFLTSQEERLSHLHSRDRMALGVLPDGKIVMAWLHRLDSKGTLSFGETARLLQTLGVTDAIALDGGFSRALLADLKDERYAGRYIALGRPIANAILLTHRAKPLHGAPDSAPMCAHPFHEKISVYSLWHGKSVNG